MSAGTPEPWLPDLCRLPRVAMAFAVAELVVLVLALSPDGGAGWNLQRFASASGFALWLALAICVLLCAGRKWLSRFPRMLGAGLAVLAAAAMALLGASLLHSLDRNLAYHLVPLSIGVREFALGSAAIAALITAVLLRYLYVLDDWHAQVQASARARADAMQARIRPHFLFNSLNTIAGLVRTDARLAETAVLDLSDLFRASLGADDTPSTLAQEIELVERYLGIEQLRLGPRLQVAWAREEPLPWALAMPLLVVQPLVENAVLHGVSRLAQGGRVEIGLDMEGDELRIRVRNPVPTHGGGFDHAGTGHAQDNIGHRLAYAYGPRARMSRGPQDGYYLCELRIPVPAALRATGDGR